MLLILILVSVLGLVLVILLILVFVLALILILLFVLELVLVILLYYLARWCVLARGGQIKKKAHFFVEAYTPPFSSLQRGKILKLQVFCAFCAHISRITFVLWDFKNYSSLLYFYEVILNDLTRRFCYLTNLFNNIVLKIIFTTGFVFQLFQVKIIKFLKII